MGKRRKEAAAAVPAGAPGSPWFGGRRELFLAGLLAAWAWLCLRSMAMPFIPAAWKALANGLGQSLSSWNPAARLGPSLAWTAGLWFTAAGLGGPVVRSLGLRAGRAESFLLCAGFGFGALSLSLLALGAGGAFSPRALRVFFWAAAAASFLCWMRGFPVPEAEAPGALKPRSGLERGLEWAMLAVLAVSCVLNLFCSAVPEIYYDSLNYHLALPSLYLARGGVFATPHNIFSGLPFGGQMLYGLAMALADEKLASLLHASFGLAVSGVVYLVGRRFLSHLQGLAAAVLYCTLPLGMYSSWSCGVDHIGAFYCAAGLAAMLRGLEAEGAGWPACSGLLLGFAAGTKYNILTIPVVLAAVQAWVDRGAGRPMRRPLVLLGAAAACFAPWMVKNIAFFGNPLYPFLTGLLPGAERIADPAGFFSASRAMGLSAIFSSFGGMKAWLLQQRIAFLGNWPVGDWVGPLIPVLAPWALFVPWKRPVEKALLGCAVLGYLSWAVTSGLVRFLLPSYPALSLFLAAAVGSARWPRALRGLGLLGLLYVCLFQVQVAIKQSWNMDFWGYLSGRVSKEDFLLKPHETYALPYYSAARFIGKETPAGSRVLVLGESRTFYIGRETIAATIFDHNPFWEALRRSSSPAELRGRLRVMGVTHILVNAYQFIYRSSSASVLPRDLASSPVLEGFWQEYLKPVFEDRHDANPQPGWLLVYELLDEPRKGGAPLESPALQAVLILAKLAARNKGTP